MAAKYGAPPSPGKNSPKKGLAVATQLVHGTTSVQVRAMAIQVTAGTAKRTEQLWQCGSFQAQYGCCISSRHCASVPTITGTSTSMCAKY